MFKVTFKQAGGATKTAAVPEGLTVMEAAVKNDVRGIDADCGGACSCATCHVHVDPDFFRRLDPMSETERDMLDLAENVDETSRLSCQIRMTEALDGLIVTVPQA